MPELFHKLFWKFPDWINSYRSVAPEVSLLGSGGQDPERLLATDTRKVSLDIRVAIQVNLQSLGRASSRGRSGLAVLLLQLVHEPSSFVGMRTPGIVAQAKRLPRLGVPIRQLQSRRRGSAGVI